MRTWSSVGSQQVQQYTNKVRIAGWDVVCGIMLIVSIKAIMHIRSVRLII